VKDLLGLLVFLRYEPYCSIKHVWRSLISAHKYEFRKLFGKLALRHSKQSVRDELTLPKQNRMVITMPFTPVEEQLYQELFEKACADVGLDANGAPLSETWTLDAASESMRRWLVRLRQTALHPEVGGRNRKDLRQRDGPLRTVDQVLEAMIEQADALIRTDQRALLTSKLRRGQLLENSPRVKEALAIWDEVVHEAAQMVVECRDQLKEEIFRAQSDEASKGKISEDISENESDVVEEQDE
jgi:E3 ubiquitin-protein ligase SHPRH